MQPVTSWEDIGPLLEAHRDGLLSSSEAARVEAFVAEASEGESSGEPSDLGGALDFEELYPEFSFGEFEAKAFAQEGRWRSVLRPSANVPGPTRGVSGRWIVLALAALFLGVLGLSLQEQPEAPPALDPVVMGSGSGSGSGSLGIAVEAASKGDTKIVVGAEAAAGSGSGG